MLSIIVGWHRTGFRLYWKLISRVRHPVGRKILHKEVRELIFRMVDENPTWGAPRIHGELLMLGFDISERTSRWMRRAPRRPELAKRWLAFLRNHREVIAAMDFFTVPTAEQQLSVKRRELPPHNPFGDPNFATPFIEFYFANERLAKTHRDERLAKSYRDEAIRLVLEEYVPAYLILQNTLNHNKITKWSEMHDFRVAVPPPKHDGAFLPFLPRYSQFV